MATAASASASPAAFGAKTPGPSPSPKPSHASAFPRPPPRASAPGRLHANSLHLGGATATGSSSVVGNGSGVHLAAPVLAPLAVPKMSGAIGARKSVLLFHCEEMRELAEQVVARNDDIELRSISWRSQALLPPTFITIAFPDDGAWKRFYKQLQHFPMVVCNKVREGEQRIVRIKEGDPRGRHVVIVDDLVQSGGTLIECQKVLAEHGAAKVSAYVTHGIFPNKSWQKFQPDNGGMYT
ncbi:hypothetical protein E2562_038224 [Oryza meyeriana var. granulata]|uniref:Phosphoribosyltransferase domain-containing protein n=1 Tax=Oryza meyeriana var. granulata TaxID=110450 RepID=A0A6G1E8N2_9ORYZ|nr:hypothetical protein E2562_038224 [Oryza meyeriana var. granulata]